MPSKIHRRSGNAVTQHFKILKWHPDVVWQVGVGLNHQEIDCLLEEWPDIRMIGFEPHPGIYKGIKDKFPGKLFNLAVTSKIEEITLYAKPNHKDGSSTREHFKDDHNRNPIKVPTTYLDVFIPSDSPIDPAFVGNILLWLDCEGAELDVLEGAREFIKHVQVVNVEMTGAPEGKGWCSPEEVNQQLHEDGFFLQITHTNRPSAGQFDGLYVRPELFNPGYCNCPMEITRYRKAMNL